MVMKLNPAEDQGDVLYTADCEYTPNPNFIDALTKRVRLYLNKKYEAGYEPQALMGIRLISPYQPHLQNRSDIHFEGTLIDYVGTVGAIVTGTRDMEKHVGEGLRFDTVLSVQFVHLLSDVIDYIDMVWLVEHRANEVSDGGYSYTPVQATLIELVENGGCDNEVVERLRFNTLTTDIIDLNY